MSHRRALVGFLFLSAILSGTCTAAMPAESAMIGSPFPHSLEAPDQAGKPQSLQSVQGKNGVAIFFVRSADWCPFCKHQLVDANRHLEAFQKLGLNVVSVSVDEVTPIAEFAMTQHIGYTMLSDPQGAINLSLGIRDEKYPTGSRAFGVPRPTIYIVDSHDVIRLRYQEATYLRRPNLDGVLRDVAALHLEARVP